MGNVQVLGSFGFVWGISDILICFNFVLVRITAAVFINSPLTQDWCQLTIATEELMFTYNQIISLIGAANTCSFVADEQ